MPKNTKDTIPATKPLKHRIYSIRFAEIYPLYLHKIERKGRMKKELDTIIHWLTGYTVAQAKKQIAKQITFEEFFDKAPHMNPLRKQITGTICGVRIEDIQDPLMKEIRYLDKLVDELAKGRELKKILRG